jgi:hypothetical protein
MSCAHGLSGAYGATKAMTFLIQDGPRIKCGERITEVNE